MQGDKRVIQTSYKNIFNHKKQYVVSMLHQVGITIGVVSQLLDYDVKNEFDPLLIERIKACMK